LSFYFYLFVSIFDIRISELSFMGSWRLIIDDNHDAFTNMAIDEAILQHTVASSTRTPTLRFYTWSCPSISIGRFQNIGQEINLANCKQDKVPVVRRPTGGRAVFHNAELTYSITIPTTYPGLPANITESYKIISAGFVRGLKLLGINASLERPKLEIRNPKSEIRKINSSEGALLPKSNSSGAELRHNTLETPQSAIRPSTPFRINNPQSEIRNPKSASPLCFASTSRYEVTISGKKLIGSAQRRIQNAMLQQGSILLDYDAEKDQRYFLADESSSIASYVTAINNHLPEPVKLDTLINHLVQGFAKQLQIDFEPTELTKQEKILTESLLTKKYQTDTWNHLR
jgi:lipoate-protein ligase A